MSHDTVTVTEKFTKVDFVIKTIGRQRIRKTDPKKLMRDVQWYLMSRLLTRRQIRTFPKMSRVYVSTGWTSGSQFPVLRENLSLNRVTTQMEA